MSPYSTCGRIAGYAKKQNKPVVEVVSYCTDEAGNKRHSSVHDVETRVPQF